ncbi:MAG: sigma-54 dependent transcriptional regulator [Desulfobacteraceae bacterium]|jgi:DNA-binding NtrC family response regulator
MTKTILVVDDELDMLQLLQRSLEKELGCRVEVASSGEMALDQLDRHAVDLLVTDIRMSGMSGLELLQQVKLAYPNLTVVMMTGFGDIEVAVKAMKQGAYDFITKPFDHDALVLRLEKALERTRLVKENLRLQRECRDNSAYGDLVGKSPAMQKVFETLQMVAQTEMTVLITGESGTGKELAARAVHSLSPRSAGPFVTVNCPTLPESILESELFGYRKGAFTHATQNKIGLFQEANGGSIFLDEIGDISLVIQTKLLRVLQEKEIKPLGDTKTIKVDTRIIASTNQDLDMKIDSGDFREDVYYRINVLPVRMPPLRERVEDIPLIANFLVEKHCAEIHKPLKQISAQLMDQLMKREWAGNIRELENAILRGILFAAGDEIRPGDIDLPKTSTRSYPDIEVDTTDTSYKDAKERVLSIFNHRYIGNLLKLCKGNVTQAAEKCGMKRQALQQIIRRYQIKTGDYRK